MKLQCSTLANIMLCTVLITLCGMLVGCAEIRVVPQKIIASMRKQGENRASTPGQTQKKYNCGASQMMLRLEETQVLPEIVTPGDEINHRIRYAFCPSTPSGTIKGSIIRVVLFKGTERFRDVTHYEFKPGTWVIDAFIGIPQEAAGGEYTLNVVLQYAGKTTKESKSFVVKDK